MKEIKRIELLSSKKSKVTRLKLEAYEIAESYCLEKNINIGVYLSNAILEKLEKDGIIRLVQ